MRKEVESAVAESILTPRHTQGMAVDSPARKGFRPPPTSMIRVVSHSRQWSDSRFLWYLYITVTGTPTTA
jgi:hypothetical protein